MSDVHVASRPVAAASAASAADLTARCGSRMYYSPPCSLHACSRVQFMSDTDGKTARIKYTIYDLNDALTLLAGFLAAGQR
jgi:hypothetical protein